LPSRVRLYDLYRRRIDVGAIRRADALSARAPTPHAANSSTAPHQRRRRR